MFFNDLPDKLLLKIVSYLPTKELPRTGQLAKRYVPLSKADYLWKSQLIKEFHFTEKTVVALRQQKLHKNYQETYRYCKKYKLNKHQQEALEELRNAGLTENHLRGRDWINTSAHRLALEHLIRGRRQMTPTQSVAELVDSNEWYQAFGINCGLSREEVLTLTEHQCFALYKCRDLGLKAEHLRGQDWFNSVYHATALIELMQKRDISATEAMAEIQGLNENQLKEISQGQRRDEVLRMTHRTGLSPA